MSSRSSFCPGGGGSARGCDIVECANALGCCDDAHFDKLALNAGTSASAACWANA